MRAFGAGQRTGRRLDLERLPATAAFLTAPSTARGTKPSSWSCRRAMPSSRATTSPSSGGAGADEANPSPTSPPPDSGSPPLPHNGTVNQAGALLRDLPAAPNGLWGNVARRARPIAEEID